MNWREVLARFEDHERRFREMVPAEPMPEAEYCRESPHRTLGHLTACEISWLPILQAIFNGDPKGRSRMHPNMHFRKEQFAVKPWAELLDMFLATREEWRRLLDEVDLDREIQTRTRIHNARTLTQKLVDHESRHLADLPSLKANH